MRFWTLVKIVAGTLVISLGAFTFLVVWHNRVKSVATPGGVISSIVSTEEPPLPAEDAQGGDPKAPSLDPGIKVFEKAKELIAMGDYAGARERLENIVATYPRSESAPEAKRIVGEMNMDDLLSPAHMDGKTVHVVQKGESFLGIAAKENTTIDCIMYLNGMLELSALHPGDELTVMPLDLHLLIDPAHKTLSVMKGDRFIKEYKLLSADTGGLKANQTLTVANSYGLAGDKRVNPAMKGYRESQKIFSLAKSALQIRGESPQDPGAPQAPGPAGKGFVLATPDAEELALITRPGNQVDIRLGPP